MSALQPMSSTETNYVVVASAPTIPSLSEPPMFSSPWWLDAVAPGAWGEVTIKRNDELRARLAYASSRHPFVGNTLGIPPLTLHLGPELYNLKRTGNRQLGEQHELMDELIDKLPPHDRFVQNFHPCITNWLPFYWRGFAQHTRYTYQLQDLTNLDAVWDNFSTRTRNVIRKAERVVSVKPESEPKNLYRLLQLTYARQGRSARYSCHVLQRTVDAALARDQGRLWVARDAMGRPHAGMFLVWNRDIAYYLVGGSDPALRSSGAMSLLIWHAIRFAANVSRCFDFEGSMQPGIELFMRGFDPVQVPYSQVRRETARIALALRVKRIFRRALPRD